MCIWDRPDVRRDLMDHGDQVVADLLGVVPERSIFVLPPTSVPYPLHLLIQLGVERFIVSADHLDPRPPTASAEPCTLYHSTAPDTYDE